MANPDYNQGSIIPKPPKKKNAKKKYIKQRSKSLKSECDDLWSKLIKLRAGNKSELSGKTDRLNSHHLVGKASNRLRYDLDNGFCLTSGEHFFTAHVEGRVAGFREKVKQIRGKDIFKHLRFIQKTGTNTKLSMVKLFLLNELKKFGE